MTIKHAFDQMYTPNNETLIRVEVFGPLTPEAYRFLAEFCVFKAEWMERRQELQPKPDEAP